MKTLYVIYDPRCGVCSRAREWLQRQPVYVPLALVPAGSAAVERLFPSAGPLTAGSELVAISDAGEVYIGDKAWIMTLWALCEYRDLALRFSNPALAPLAREAFRLISASRHKLSKWLGLMGDADLRRALVQQEAASPWDACRLRD